VQDRGTYYRLGVEVPTGQVVLQKLMNGQPGELLRVTVSGLVLTQPQNWRIKMSGTNHDNLDVWLQVNGQGTWQHVIDSGGNGAGRLGDIPAGYAGLSVPCRCESFKIGYNTSGADGALDQVLFTDGFDGPLSVTLTYDANGNLTGDGLYRYTYDAWNRLVRVQRTGPGAEPDDWHEIARYGYDGLGRRVRKTVSHSGDRNRQEYFYYNQAWQLLEIADADNQAKQQFIWGQTYIDEPICMDVDTDNDGNCTDAAGSPLGARRFFYCQDANYNVIALREGGDIVERYEYDPYGTVRIYKGWSTAAGRELLEVTGQSLKWLDANLPSNPFLYGGYFHDNETGLYHVRHRMYSPQLQRWLQRDPAGYVDGMSLYQYARGMPVSGTDPSGLAIILPPPLLPPVPPSRQVCCKGTTAANHSQQIWHAQPWQKTIDCKTGRTAKECCECYAEQQQNNDPPVTRRKRTIAAASEGKCCSCRIEERSQPVSTRHTILYIKCDNGRELWSHWYGGPPTGGEVPPGSGGIVNVLPIYSTVHMTGYVDCDCVDKIMQYAQTWANRIYMIWPQNCWNYTSDVFDWAMTHCHRGQ